MKLAILLLTMIFISACEKKNRFEITNKDTVFIMRIDLAGTGSPPRITMIVNIVG
jgi:hypothetical protein